MIPVSLTIKGLYSYQQETTIDFTNLTQAGLFGIFGAVGSGKSTILEAISFALYGETERLNSRDSRSYNMMNLKTNEIMIDFTFTCGDCADTFRFTVSARRNLKKFNEAGAFERKAYILKDKWIPTELDAEKILGLSYDNFKRTIIIPQGKFQEFLQLKDAERVQMLKEIFSLEKFELSPKVSKLSKENELSVSNLQGQMHTLPVRDEQLIEDRKANIELLDKEVKDVTGHLKNKQAEEQFLQELKALFIDVNLKTIALKALQSKEKKMDELDRQIRAFERCEQVFKYPVENRNKLGQTITKQRADIEKLRGDKIAIAAAVASESDKVVELKDSYANRDLLLQKASQLEKVVSIKSLKENITALSTRVEKGDRAVKDEEQNLEGIKEQLTDLKSKIALAEKALPNTALLISVSNWFKAAEQLKINLKKTEQEVTQASDKASKAKTDIESKLKQLPAEITRVGFPSSLSVVKIEIDNLTSKYNQQLQSFKDEQNHLKLYQKLDEFAKGLSDESACPLCGSVHHPKVFSAANVTRDIEQKQVFIDNIENKKNYINTTLLHLSGIYSNYETYSLQYNQKQQELLKHKSELETYVAEFNFAGYTIEDYELVKKQQSEIEEKNIAIKKLREQQEDKDKKGEEATKKISAYKSGIEKFKTDKAQQEGQLETLKGQLLLLDLSIEMDKPVPELTKNVGALKTQYAQITKEFEQAEKALHENNKVLATLTGRVGELENQINSSVIQLAELNRLIKSLLITEGYQSEVDVEKILSIKLDITKDKQRVEAFRMELHTATIQLRESTAKGAGKEYNEAAHITLQQTIEGLSKELSDKTEKLVTKRFELQDLHERMQARQKLQQDLDKLTVRAENLKVLSNLFRSSGFVNYVSSVYLQNLINSANQRFYKMTRQKLMLELAEDNAFRVRDFMNNGEVRSVKTLSGGQTFQAALSLALALADNIQHLTKSKQNFFFLDEGFGSLDKEALAIVFDTLKGLRKENRIVGVISHVDETQQEIPVNLKITNDIERGSLVTKSWH
jgi:exonuclease SbcC